MYVHVFCAVNNTTGSSNGHFKNLAVINNQVAKHSGIYHMRLSVNKGNQT